MRLDRSTFYARPDGGEMTSRERLSLLLRVGCLDTAEAARLTGLAPSTLETYRKPSSKREVPTKVLRPLERHLLAHLRGLVEAAGYAMTTRPAD